MGSTWRIDTGFGFLVRMHGVRSTMEVLDLIGRVDFGNVGPVCLYVFGEKLLGGGSICIIRCQFGLLGC